MGGLDLSKGSNDLKMYISRNTGPLSNTDKSCHTLICIFRKRVSLKNIVPGIFHLCCIYRNDLGKFQ